MWLRSLTVLVVTACLAGCSSRAPKTRATRQADADDSSDRKSRKADATDRRLDGTWTIVAAEREGRPISKPVGTELTFDRGEVTVRQGQHQKEGKYLTAAGKGVKLIDMAVIERGAVEEERGIYAVEGDKLKLCMAETGEARPKSLATTPGKKNIVLLVLKRIKSLPKKGNDH